MAHGAKKNQGGQEGTVRLQPSHPPPPCSPADGFGRVGQGKGDEGGGVAGKGGFPNSEQGSGRGPVQVTCIKMYTRSLSVHGWNGQCLVNIGNAKSKPSNVVSVRLTQPVTSQIHTKRSTRRK